MNRLSRPAVVLLAILAVGALLRGGVVWRWGERLSEDRDAYLAIGRHLADGQGFASQPGEPTAYRPPLYPLMLAGIFALGGGTTALGAVHVLLGAGTVWLTYRLGRRLGMDRGALLAAGLVAVDPLLLYAASLPMTETLFTFLVIALLNAGRIAKPSCNVAAAEKGSDPVSQHAESNAACINRETGSDPFFTMRSFATGLLFGLCALCRPTIWAFGALVVLRGGYRVVRRRFHTGPQGRSDRQSVLPRHWSLVIGHWSFLVLGVALVVLPWTLRNWFVLGRPVVTTTHGGYTLLLGNNPVFFREVLEQPFGTVWSGESLKQWQEDLERNMRAHDPPVAGEIARDRWMYRRALSNIQDDPVAFLRACWLRFLRFWNPVPLGAAAESVSAPIRWAAGLWNTGLLLAFGCAAVRAFYTSRRSRRRRQQSGFSEKPGLSMERPLHRGWILLAELILAFTLVHLFYWTNARMRAPLIPAVALLAARLLKPRQAPRRSGESDQPVP